MAVPEITRCDNCSHECDEPFKRVAAELLLIDDGTSGALKKAEDKEALLNYRLHKIIGCTLTSRQITTNLEELMEGNLDING